MGTVNTTKVQTYHAEHFQSGTTINPKQSKKSRIRPQIAKAYGGRVIRPQIANAYGDRVIRPQIAKADGGRVLRSQIAKAYGGRVQGKMKEVDEEKYD